MTVMALDPRAPYLVSAKLDVPKMLAWLASKEGAPYLWGGRGSIFGDGTPTPYEGWDCWGLVAGALAEASGLNLLGWWTDRAWLALLPVATPAPGDLVFYAPRTPSGPQDVEHVEVVVARADPAQDRFGWRTIGASGGSHVTTTLALARSMRACVKYRPSHLDHMRFAGFRRVATAA